MPTRGTRCRGIRDDQDEILVSQQGMCPGRDNPPHQSAANERASLGMEMQTVLREHGRGPARRAWPDSEKASRTGTPREAAVTVAKSKGVIKDTEPQSCIHRAPASPRSTDKRKGAASPDLAGPDSTVRRGDLAGGAVTAVSPAPQRLLLQTWHSTNTC